MSHKNNDRGSGQEYDVDFDFFDTPREVNSPKKKDSLSGKVSEPVASTSRSGSGKANGSASASGSSNLENSHSDSHNVNKQHGKHQPYPSDSDPETESDGEINVKIAARVPTAANDEADSDNYSDNFESDSDSDDDDLKNSGRRAPTPMSGRNGRKRSGSADSNVSDRKDTAQKPQAWGKETLGKHKEKELANGRKGVKAQECRQQSLYGSDCSTDSSTDWSSDDSDVTDVSPLASPRRHTRVTTKHQKHKGDRSGRAYGKPPVSPSYKDRSVSSTSGSARGGSDGGTSLERLLHANRDTMDLKLLMQAVLEMEQRESLDTQPKRQKPVSVPPPAGPLPQHRRNFSFSNDAIRTIDKENQRLMQQILKNAVQTKQAKQKAKSKKAQPSYQSKITSAAINRKREQERIEAENRAMLRRLHSTRATKAVQRDQQLHEYNRHTLFGVSVAAAHSSLNRKSPYETASNPRSHSVAGWHTNSDLTPGKPGRARPQSATATMGGARPSGGSRSRPSSATSGSRSRPVSASSRDSSSLGGPAKKPRPQSGKASKHSIMFTKTAEEEWEGGW